MADPRAFAVYIEGPSDSPCAVVFGRYERSEEMCQQRHVYVAGDGERAMWWAHGSWYIGRKANVGKRSGALTAMENTDVPEDIVAPWMMAAEGNAWVATEGVACITEDAHITKSRAALEECSS